MKSLKRFITLFLMLCLSVLSFAQRTSKWEILVSPTTETLRKLYFVDEYNGWAAGLGGSIINTNNSGKSWQVQNTNVSTPIVDIFFLNPQKGWALTYPSEPPFGTSILKTTDGGLSWQTDSIFFENEIFATIYFNNESIGFIGGNGIKKTTDGGLSWFNTFIEPGGVSTLPINKFIFYSSTFGYACGGRVDIAGVIWKTTDGGNNWSSQGLSPDQIYDVYIIDSLNAISLSGDPELLYTVANLRTTDAGATWKYDSLPIFGIAYAIDFLNYNEGYAAAGFQFLKTGDGGKSWDAEIVTDSLTIYDLQFVDKYTGFACGQDGALLKFTSFKKDAPNKPIFELGQNYPNPFSEKTAFNVYSITPDFDQPAQAKIKLYTVLGNEILTIVDQVFYSGIYEFTFNPAEYKKSLSSGIYIVTLISGDVLISKKIVYLK